MRSTNDDASRRPFADSTPGMARAEAPTSRRSWMPSAGTPRGERRWYPLTVETNSLRFGDNLKLLSQRNADGTFRFPSASFDPI